jgi:prepilin-type N-terminal cleavage/methylation domain-containing protein
MNCAPSRHGAPRQNAAKRDQSCQACFTRRGFTLLEMCIVLFIIALLCGVTMPAITSAFTEQKMRNDAHQLALMVKTAMIRSSEQHRAYVIDVTASTMSLHPGGTKDDDDSDDSSSSSAPSDEDGSSATVLENVTASGKLDPPNKFLAPDPHKLNGWVPMPTTSWVFQPGELCVAPRVRLERGDAYLEMSFNALTGDVENEAEYNP